MALLERPGKAAFGHAVNIGSFIESSMIPSRILRKRIAAAFSGLPKRSH
jgi:hypothetical protein